jgi:hypothetical protein
MCNKWNGPEASSTVEALEKNLVGLFETKTVSSPLFTCPNIPYKTRERPANERPILTDRLLRPVDLTYVRPVNHLKRIYTSLKFLKEGNITWRRTLTQLNVMFCR